LLYTDKVWTNKLIITRNNQNPRTIYDVYEQQELQG